VLRGSRDHYVRTIEALINTVIQRYRLMRKDGRGDLVCSEYNNKINNSAAANVSTNSGITREYQVCFTCRQNKLVPGKSGQLIGAASRAPVPLSTVIRKYADKIPELKNQKKKRKKKKNIQQQVFAGGHPPNY
jgi:hypothetical protein